MAKLLISVRDADEAREIVDAGVSLVDVKDPGLGSLGRASDACINAVADVVADRVPASAALGEFRDWNETDWPSFVARLRHVKWGLADAPADWDRQLREWKTRLEAISNCGLVLAAYADHQRAQAPELQEICRIALRDRYEVMLIDTWKKDGTTLMDWASLAELEKVVSACRRGGVKVALAGSLGIPEMTRLAGLAPDWFAIRGAACVRGMRGSSLVRERVEEIAQQLNGFPVPSR